MGLRDKLIESLSSVRFRRQFVSAQVRRLVSGQIRKLRESNAWTQAELGKKAGMKQGVISRLESPDYGDFTINTLLRLAEAFDVGLIVRFAPFSELVNWNQKVSPQDYTPASFKQDRGLRPRPVESDLSFLRPKIRPIASNAIASQPTPARGAFVEMVPPFNFDVFPQPQYQTRTEGQPTDYVH